MKTERLWAPALAAWLVAGGLLAGCGGGVDGIDGTISGLTADGLELSNGSETISLDEGSTSFSFATVLDAGDGYAITVTTQPTGLFCSVGNGTGVVGDETSISVDVSCTPVFGISGRVSNLSDSGLVLRLRSGDDADSLTDTETLAVAAGADSFAFVERLEEGTFYEVTVETQPSTKRCRVNASDDDTDGTVVTDEVGTVAVTNLAVSCD